MFRHDVLSKEPVVIQMAVKYLNATMTNLVKVSGGGGEIHEFIHPPSPKYFLRRSNASFLLQSGFPSKNDSPACEYARVDFDSDEDFNAFFHCKPISFPAVRLVYKD